MSLSLAQKQLFYEQLGQLLRAGIPIQQSLNKMSIAADGSVRRFLKSVSANLDAGATIGEAFGAARPALSDLERATLAGLSRSGQMERGLAQLSIYFGAMHRARHQILKKILYPIFLLHFSVLVMHVQLLVTDGIETYGLEVGKTLLGLYAVIFVGWALVTLLLDAGTFIPAADRLLRMVPLLGKIRRSFATSRFCATYNLQLEAGVNVLDSLKSAGLASRSGLVRHATNRAIISVRDGEQVGPALAKSRSAFPRDMLGAFLVAEESGQLDVTLDRLAAEYQAAAFSRMETATEWIPRIFFIAVSVLIGWKVFMAGKGYVQMLDDVGRVDSF